MRRLIAILLLLSSGSVLFCQQTKDKEIPEELTEKILLYAESAASDESGRENQIEELIDLFQSLMVSPLDINKATREDLERLAILNDFQVESILDYRKEYGTLLSVNELFQIPGFDTGLVTLLTRFISVSPTESSLPLNPSSLVKEGKSQILLRAKSILEKQHGYSPVTKEEFEKNPDCRYLGSPGTLYAQYKYVFSDRLTAGVTLERDPGERGIDYKSLNISLYKTGLLERLVIGDYIARFGQGLILWNSFFLNSTTEPKSLKKSETGITPYNSTDENLSFRGIAATIEMRRLKLSLFGSHRAYDARIAEGRYTSLLKTGLHNTKTTIERKGSLKGSLLGANLSYSGNSFKISENMIIYKYNLPYGGRDTLKHSKELAPGGYGINAGADFYWVMDKIRLFGEVAIDRSASIAGLSGILFSLCNKLEMALLIREHSENYYAPFTNPEKGIQISAAYYLGKYWKLSSGLEIRSGYHNLSVTSNFNNEKGISYYFKFSKIQNRTSLRNSISYPVAHWLRFANRIDFTLAKEDKMFIGTHIFHEALCESGSGKVDASFRIAAFNIPVWDARVYAYERDVLYGFSTPVCYGKGIRWYFNIHYTPLRSLDFWFKISQTRYLDRDKIGEGLDMIEGPSKSEAKLQIRWKF